MSEKEGVSENKQPQLTHYQAKTSGVLIPGRRCVWYTLLVSHMDWGDGSLTHSESVSWPRL